MVKKVSKVFHLFPLNLACFAPWRESIPHVREIQITGSVAQAAHTLNYSNTKITRGFFVYFALLYVIVSPACANFYAAIAVSFSVLAWRAANSAVMILR
ncbi:MAG: hypothetical protein ABIP88_06375, partial [Candidatus Binatia bacterium]